MNMKVYGLLGILFCKVVCINGMNMPFIISKSQNFESVYNSDNSFEDKLDSLQNKLAELQSQINPPLLKSWLIWGGKTALVAGGVSLTTYFAWRYYFDVASPQDVKNAFNEVHQTAERNNVELQAFVQEGMQHLQSTVTQQLNDKKTEWNQLLQANNSNLDQHMNMLRSGMLEVKNNMNQSQNKLNSMLGNHFEGQQAQMDEFRRQIGLDISVLGNQVEQQAGLQQEKLDALHQSTRDLRNSTLKLAVDTTKKLNKIESHRQLLDQVFEAMSNNPQSSLLEN